MIFGLAGVSAATDAPNQRLEINKVWVIIFTVAPTA